MGIYNSAVITSTGQALLALSVAGNELKFTTVKTSNYAYPAGTNLADLTTITGIKQSKNITNAVVYNSRVVKVSAMVDNAGVTAEYSINTIGIYATVGTAAEQLFAVITAQEADKMPAFNSRPYSYIYDMNMTMQGTSNITVTVNNAGFVNVNDLNNALEGINNSISALESDKVNVSDIVNDLTSSDTDKTLSAAMGAELNVKSTTSLSADIPTIPDNANLNDYTTPGSYAVRTDGSAATITNIPHKASGRLTVIDNVRGTYLTQIYIPSTALPYIYLRAKAVSSWSAWQLFNNTEELQITRTEQEYVTAVSLGRCKAFKRNGYLFFKGNIEMSYGSGFSDFKEIGKISGWSAADAVYVNVPAQSGGGTVACFAIYADGQIRVYSATAFSNVPFFRFIAVAPIS